WKHVSDREPGAGQRPHLTVQNHLLGTGHFAAAPDESEGYRTGYLCGVIRGDGLLGSYSYSYSYSGRRRQTDSQHHFRLAMVDSEALARTGRYLREFEVATREFLFQAAVGARKSLFGIRTHARANVARIREIVEWPSTPSPDWLKGFLAGIFDAEGSYSGGILRISNTNAGIISRTVSALRFFEFDAVVETRSLEKPVHDVRIRHGLREHLRFFHTVRPVISRKQSIEGQAIKNDSRLRVVSVKPLGLAMKLYDVTTGTGDFIADGVVSHNCYARSSHEYLGFGAGTDFDRKIVVKTNAPELLRAELTRRSWKGDSIAFSGNTDCYQPLEAVYELTRRCLEICLEFRNPVGLITKGALVRRDVDLLAALAREASATVHLSICFADDEMSRAIEPNTSSPSQRFETIRILSDAGIRTGVGIAPVIPGLNDDQVAEILARARAAGATEAFRQPIRLSGATLPVFRERLQAAYPARAAKVWNAILEMRGGRLNETEFGARGRGLGPRWAAVEALYRAECRRLGFDRDEETPRASTFRRPKAQGALF
ncbi:MAG: radical SAM protein, partial [Acidobacteriota bacterium]